MPAMKSAFGRPSEGIESIAIREAPVPDPAPGEALVRIRAATPNYRDLLVLRGLVPGAKEPEYVPLSDGAGEVVAVADGVTRVKVGDRVNPLFALGWLTGPRPTMEMLGGPADGVAREFFTCDAESLVVLPDALSDLEAAALPCAGLTAWNALFGHRPLQKGEWVLLQGTGGVSIAALQWAKAAGAYVAITSSSDAKLKRAEALGADITINYRTAPDWANAALEARNGAGYDIVVDVVGEAQTAECARTLAEDGIIAAVGRLEGEASWGKDVGKPVVPIVIGNREQHEAMVTFANGHGIHPVIDTSYDLDDLASALRHLESGTAFGKIGIRIG